ncbi:MAG TPA: hypothetical protein ENJ95_12440, partial [Bacteroidetes bacterium]|nr:hypothetical protein [Bacteroidota bacterium]
FDPNTATKEELIRLGILPRTANTLLNYRSKGGRFFKKEDLKKVYGFRKEDYNRLEEWIVVNNEKTQREWDNKKSKSEKPKPSFAGNNSKKTPTGGADKKSFYPKKEYPKKEYTPPMIDINKTTAEDWQKLRGIGPAYSKRIVNFRDKLGGFVSVEQVGTTYNLPDSTFQKIKPYLTLSPVFRKIKVNQLDLKGLKSHPYISSYQATILFNYRKQHGDFTDMESLKKIKAGFKEEDWKRLEGYLSFE